MPNEAYVRFTDAEGKIIQGQFKTRLDVFAGKLQNTEVRIGVTDATQVEKAKIHEFGSNRIMEFEEDGKKYRIKGVPARSFLRMPLSLFLSRALEEAQTFIEDNNENANVEAIAELLGQTGVEVIHEAFASQGFGQWPSHISEEYKKDNDNPVLDKTGRLKNSIGYEIVNKETL